MKAGIALDDWKLPVFRKRLTDGGFKYSDAGEAMPGITMLTVIFRPDEKAKLTALIVAANAECARKGPPKP